MLHEHATRNREEEEGWRKRLRKTIIQVKFIQKQPKPVNIIEFSFQINNKLYYILPWNSTDVVRLVNYVFPSIRCN